MIKIQAPKINGKKYLDVKSNNQHSTNGCQIGSSMDMRGRGSECEGGGEVISGSHKSLTHASCPQGPWNEKSSSTASTQASRLELDL